MPVGKLFMTNISPPCRAVLLCAKALGIEVQEMEVNLLKGEHMTPEFIKMNPGHTVPTYIDNDGTTIADSHTIMAYLVGKYGKDDSLYPKDLAKRAAVDQRLHFDSGAVYSLHYAIVVPMWQKMETRPSAMQKIFADKMYQSLNTYLEGNTWVAGTKCLTIADFSLATSIMAISVVAPYDKKYTNITEWIKRVEGLPYHDSANKVGRDFYVDVLKCMLKGDYAFMQQIVQ